MPQIAIWSQLPTAIRDHLVERMHDRHIGLDDLNQLRLWMESKPHVPLGTRTLARSSCAATAATQRHCCFPVNWHEDINSNFPALVTKIAIDKRSGASEN